MKQVSKRKLALVVLVFVFAGSIWFAYSHPRPVAETSLSQLGLPQTAGIETVTFYPDGQILALSAGDLYGLCAVLLLDVDDLRPIQSIDTCRSDMLHPMRAEQLAISPDGRIMVMASSTDETIVFIDLQDGRMTMTQRIQSIGTDVRSIGWSPMGNIIAIGTEDNHVRLWDVHTENFSHLLMGLGSSLMCMSFSADGQYIMVGDYSGQIVVWDTQSGEQLSKFNGHSDGVTSCDFNPLDPNQALTSSFDHYVRFWNVLDGQMLAERNFGGFVVSASFNFDGRLFQAGTWFKDTVSVQRTSDWHREFEIVHSLPQHGHLNSSFFSPISNLLLSWAGGSIRLWRL